MLEKVYHIGYLTEDFEKAIAFYETTFNAKTTVRLTLPDGTLAAMVQAGDVEIEIVQPADTGRLGGKTGLVIDHIAYFVADIDRAVKELEAKGMIFTGEIRTVAATGYRFATMEGDSLLGARIQLFSK